MMWHTCILTARSPWQGSTPNGRMTLSWGRAGARGAVASQVGMIWRRQNATGRAQRRIGIATRWSLTSALVVTSATVDARPVAEAAAAAQEGTKGGTGTENAVIEMITNESVRDPAHRGTETVTDGGAIAENGTDTNGTVIGDDSYVVVLSLPVVLIISLTFAFSNSRPILVACSKICMHGRQLA